MNYYKRHLGDYAAATRHLSILEHGVYTLLLDLYYITEKPLPAEERAVWRLVGARSKDERESVGQILDEFFELREDGWHQTRCDEELATKEEKAARNREIGKRGGRPRKTQTVSDSETQTDDSGNPNGFREETQTVSENNPSHKPITNNQEDNPPTPLPGGSGWQKPDWVPADLWTEFEALRKKRKKPLTDRARDMAVAKLQALQDGGHDVKAVMEQSILHAWDTFYPLKSDAAPAAAEAWSDAV